MDLLAHFSERVRREGLCVHGVAVQQDGRLLAARQWSPDEPRVLHSLSKSFTALAVGMLVDEGRLRLEERVVDFFPGQRPAVPSDRLLALRVEHLLTMSAGRTGCVTIWPSPWIACPANGSCTTAVAPTC